MLRNASFIVSASLAIIVALGACGGQAIESGGGAGGENQSGTGGSHAGTSYGGPTYGATSGAGGSVDARACTQRSDCAMVPLTCCTCDGPDLHKEQFQAYNTAHPLGCGAEGDASPAPGPPPPGFTPISCVCPAPAPGEGTIQNLIPDCVAGQCVVTDLRESDLTTCTQNSQCVLRSGTGCCESCGADWVAVRDDGSFSLYACEGPRRVLCTMCASAPPPGLVAWCAPSGHCETAMQHPTAE